MLHGRDRRHDRHLRGHHRLQRDARSPLPLDAQKRLQGSHFANDEQALGVNALVTAGQVDPCLARVFAWSETGACHQLMRDNQHPSGNMAILVNAPRPGLRTLADVRGAR